MRLGAVAAAVLALAVGVTGACAQPVALGGAALFDTQRFPEADTPNRLDGAAVGWMALASVQPWPHLVVDAEWSESTITDEQSLGLDIEGRDVTITSSLAHRTRAGGVLAGFAHRPGGRVRLAYLVGVSWTGVERRFTTNAPSVVLVPPSAPAAPRTSVTAQRFTSLVGGVDALVRLGRRVHAVVGARAQALPLDADLSGRRLAVLAGAAWVF